MGTSIDIRTPYDRITEMLAEMLSLGASYGFTGDPEEAMEIARNLVGESSHEYKWLLIGDGFLKVLSQKRPGRIIKSLFGSDLDTATYSYFGSFGSDFGVTGQREDMRYGGP